MTRHDPNADAAHASQRVLSARFPALQVASLSGAACGLAQPVPVSADVLGVCLYRDQPLRHAARVVAGAAAACALPSMGQGRSRSGARARFRRTSQLIAMASMAPTRTAQTIYHRQQAGSGSAAASSYPQNRKYHLAEFSNPNQQGGQDNKSLMAMMVVFIAVLFGAQFYHAKMNPAGGDATAVRLPRARRQPPAAAAPANAPRRCSRLPQRAKPAAPSVPVVQASGETTTVIENELYRITFSNRGAPGDELDSEATRRTCKDSDGKPLDLVHRRRPSCSAIRCRSTPTTARASPLRPCRATEDVVTLPTAGNLPAGSERPGSRDRRCRRQQLTTGPTS